MTFNNLVSKGITGGKRAILFEAYNGVMTLEDAITIECAYNNCMALVAHEQKEKEPTNTYAVYND